MTLIVNEPRTLYGVWDDNTAGGAWVQRMGEPWFTIDERVALAMRINVLAHNYVSKDSISVRQLGDDGRPIEVVE